MTLRASDHCCTRQLAIFVILLTTWAVVGGQDNSFEVYWNVPTFLCKAHNVDFSDLPNYGITQNVNDEFKGEKITIFYDPGLFPSLTDSGSVEKNRGLPQLGDLDRHLQAMRKLIEREIPDQNFQGLGVLDMESWRPIWKQNWGSLLPYREYSRQIEKKNHPNWSKDKIDSEAERRFEDAARQFMSQTLSLVRQMRPRGRWGYYAFPYCFNYTPKNMQPDCPQQIRNENNQIQWLFDDSDSLYPSIYLSKNKLNEDQRRQFIEGRLNEAARVSRRSQHFSMYPYISYRYIDSPDFITQNDLMNSLSTSKRYHMGGAIIWGSSKDVNTRDKCEELANYVRNELGPIVRSITSGRMSDQQIIKTEISKISEPEDVSNETLSNTVPFYHAVLLP